MLYRLVLLKIKVLIFSSHALNGGNPLTFFVGVVKVVAAVVFAVLYIIVVVVVVLTIVYFIVGAVVIVCVVIFVVSFHDAIISAN